MLSGAPNGALKRKRGHKPTQIYEKRKKQMTKTELIEKVNANALVCGAQLAKNNARMYEQYVNGKRVVTLQSYRTLVAVAYNGTVYGFGYWSRTTAQHIHKFAHFLQAPIVWLYPMSGTSASESKLNQACDYATKLTAFD